MWNFVISGLVIYVGNTYFVEQANHLNLHVGHLVVPLALFLADYEIWKTSSTIQYIFKPDRFKSWTCAMDMPISRTYFVNIFIMVSFIITATVEMRRLRMVKKHGLQDKPENRIPMSIFFLVPQFSFFWGIWWAFKNSITHFFVVYAPLCMFKCQGFFHKWVMGLRTIGNVLSVYLVGKVSKIGENMNWFRRTLNRRWLDFYYWTLIVLSVVNFVLYNFVLCNYDFERKHSEKLGEEVSLEEEVSKGEMSLEEVAGELFEE